ncbi:MAG: glycerophosphodiester phosphodiesterase [Calditrichaeota bacterium]|nr:MAG: glycerophosphodiester phosphodiesterase [Calditrichota bacterium]
MSRMAGHSIFANKPLNFAHRGFTAKAPENTLAAFREAVELGVDGIELDVRVCKSGELVVFHDATLARMTDGRGFVKNKTLDELNCFRIRSADGMYEEKIPTLAEVIENLGERTILNVEIKTNGLPKAQIERKVVEVLRKYQMQERAIVSSFNPLVIRRIRKLDREILTGFLIDKSFNVRRSEIFLTKLTGAQAIHLDKSLATESFLKKIRDLGYYALVWSVNDPQRLKQLSDLGVEGIITDRPDLLKEIK